MATKQSSSLLSRSHKVNANIIHIIFTDMSAFVVFTKYMCTICYGGGALSFLVFFWSRKHKLPRGYTYSEAVKRGSVSKMNVNENQLHTLGNSVLSGDLNGRETQKRGCMYTYS